MKRDNTLSGSPLESKKGWIFRLCGIATSLKTIGYIITLYADHSLNNKHYQLIGRVGAFNK
ncbi:hypothetical protein [Candidatus Nitrosocosmicus arcticus]|uniref:hypothetical protein n=1 Tax=Candidatus Nitrosocosmicus arcticus TaxID=2035267 RepID=UPI0011A6EC8E|nr:hypothetical protein [Candidatus Nitrosocosmicus arcticus]